MVVECYIGYTERINMTQFDVSKTRSASVSPGITSLSSPLTFTKAFSGTIPISGTLTTSLDLTFGKSDVLVDVIVNVVGSSFDNYWFPVSGLADMYDFTHGYDIVVTSKGTTTGRKLYFDFVSNTAASTISINLTLTAEVNFSDYPF